MKYIKLSIIVFMFTFTLFGTASATSAMDKPIFDDGVTLPYFAQHTTNVLIEVSIAPANGSSPHITYTIGEIPSANIPNTLRDIYILCPKLLERVNALLPDSSYVKIQESLWEADSKEMKVLSFIGAYAQDIKHVE